jgi:hypothetical protein
MRADLTSVTPAFNTDRDALAYCMLIYLLLALPLFPPIADTLPKRAIYSAMPASFCDSKSLYKEIYEQKTDADVVFVGSSMIWNSIDVPTLQKRLRAACGIDKTVVLLGHNLFGFDADYFLLHDLVQKRRIRLVMIQMPLDTGVSPWPHVLAETWFTMDDWKTICGPGMPLTAKIALYSQAVLGAPRKILSILRKDAFGQILNNWEERSGSAYHKVGAEFHPPPPDLVPEKLFYSSSPLSFDFAPKPTNTYQLYFLNKIISLLKEHGVTVICIHPPAFKEVKMTKVIEQGCWTKLLENHPDMFGVPGSSLFEGLSEEQAKRLFEDDHHLNANGSVFFTEAISGGVIHAYQRATTIK